MGRVLLKVRPPHLLGNPPRLTSIRIVSGYYFGRQWVSPSPLRLLVLRKKLMHRIKCRKDLAHEPVCEQEVQQPVQGDHRSRLVRPLRPSAPRAGFTNSKSLSSLTKEVMVDDRLVT